MDQKPEINNQNSNPNQPQNGTNPPFSPENQVEYNSNANYSQGQETGVNNTPPPQGQNPVYSSPQPQQTKGETPLYPPVQPQNQGAYYNPQPVYIQPPPPPTYGYYSQPQNGQYPYNPQSYPPQNQGVYYTYPPTYPPNVPIYVPQPPSPQQIQLSFEKKAIKRTAGHVGFGLLVFYIVVYVLSLLVGGALGISGNESIVNDPAFQLELNLILTFFGFISAGILILKLEKIKIAQVISYGAPKKGTLLGGILLGLGLCYIANIVVAVIQSTLEGILPVPQEQIETPAGIMGFIISVLSIAVAPALLEEFVFRNAIMGSLLKFGKGFAIFTSAALFGLVHGNLAQIPFAFMVGIVLGFLTLKTNSIWTAVIVHFLNNFISVCMDYVSKYLSEDMASGIYLILVSIIIMLGLLGFFILNHKETNFFKLEKTTHISTAQKRFGWVCSTATVIVFFVIVALEVITTQLMALLV